MCSCSVKTITHKMASFHCHLIKTMHEMMSFYCVTPSRLFTRHHFTVSLHQDYSQDDVISLCHYIKAIHSVMSFHCVTALSQDYSQDNVILLCHSIKTIQRMMSFLSLDQDCSQEDVISQNFSDETVILNLLYRRRRINFQQGLYISQCHQLKRFTQVKVLVELLKIPL